MAERPKVRTRPVTRDKLATVFKSQELIKAFENLASDVGETLPAAVVDNGEAAAIAQRTANDARTVADQAAAAAAAAQASADALRLPEYLVLAPSDELENERVLEPGARIKLTVEGDDPAVLDVRLDVPTVWQRNQSVATVALADAPTIVTDATLSNSFRVTLGGNRTLADPINLADGMVLNWVVKQDATGSRTLVFGPVFDFGGAGTPLLSTLPDAVDLVSGIYDAAAGKILCAFRRATPPPPPALTPAYLSAVNVFTRNQSVAMAALTDAATVALDASLSNSFELLATSGVGATRKIGNATNATAGMVLNLWFYQDASGSRALTWDTKYKTAGGLGVPAASTAPNAVDFYSLAYSATKDTWVVTQQKGVA